VRYGINAEPVPTVEDAPESLRYHLLRYFQLNGGSYPSGIVGLLEEFLRRPGLGASFRNPHDPTRQKRIYDLIQKLEWWQVYEFIKFVYANTIIVYSREKFASGLNNLFSEQNICYRINNQGEIIYKGSEAFEVAVAGAESALAATGRNTARDEIHKALEDLSRRPKPDLTGAVHHAMAALECVAADVCGESGQTLGQVAKKHTDKFPPPLGEAVGKLYGFASERGRHITEGGEPDIKDVELVVGIAATVATYLSR